MRLGVLHFSTADILTVNVHTHTLTHARPFIIIFFFFLQVFILFCFVAFMTTETTTCLVIKAVKCVLVFKLFSAFIVKST